MPVNKLPIKKIAKDPKKRPAEPKAAPKVPPIAPIKKPIFRPYFCIISDKIGAATIDPKTIKEIGRVAKQGFEERYCPASPPKIKSIGIWEPREAPAMINTNTFRKAVLSFIESVT